MTQLLVLVLDDADQVPTILEAWESAGVPGVTLIESYGSHRVSLTRDDIPFVASLRSVLEGEETSTTTLFSVIPDDAVLDRAIAAVLQLLPDFSQGHGGVLFTVPVTRAIGVLPEPRRPK